MTTITLDTNNLQESYKLDYVAKQASGSVWYQQKNTVLVAAVAFEPKAQDEDFLPLSVQYIEKAYAAAKIPGGFIKREAKPSDFETLTSRIIDRSLRPLFPKGFNYTVAITVTVLSADEEVDLQVAAIHAASAALYLSELPVNECVSAVRLANISDTLTINPTLSQLQNSSLDLLVVGKGSDVMMIEMRTMSNPLLTDGANEIPPQELAKLIGTATKAINDASSALQEALTPYAKATIEFSSPQEQISQPLLDHLVANYTDALHQALTKMAKSERSEALKELARVITAELPETLSDLQADTIAKSIEQFKRSELRKMILNDGIRADGRALNEVRPISIETNLLPSAHGSALFTRGQTQVLAVATLGQKRDAQSYERITDNATQYETFMLHYNFPGYSVGEAGFIGAPGRRELGHGNLAKRAITPALRLDSNAALRVVSEVLESNGSSSMATICAASLAINATQTPLSELVAGVAMGLVYQEDNYAILTDIMGLEDHEGDMDFKVAGTSKGITALQMDIKIQGLNLELLNSALLQAFDAITHIRSLMVEAAKQTKPSASLPQTHTMPIAIDKIPLLIGKQGATIKPILQAHNVTIDIDNELGQLTIKAKEQAAIDGAIEDINAAINPAQSISYDDNATYLGKIKKIVDFGLFVQMPEGNDALLHISKISKERIGNLASLYEVGQMIEVVVLSQNSGKIELATPAYLDL